MCYTLLYCVILCYTVVYCVILCYTVLYCVVLSYTGLYCIILYYTALYYIILYHTVYQPQDSPPPNTGNPGALAWPHLGQQFYRYHTFPHSIDQAVLSAL